MKLKYDRALRCSAVAAAAAAARNVSSSSIRNKDTTQYMFLVLLPLTNHIQWGS